MAILRHSDILRVLVVDDDPSVRAVIGAVLGRTGMQVALATNGVEALSLIDSTPHPFDLVLLDLTMPVMNGTKTILEIERRHPGLPIMLCSGSISELRAAEEDSTGAVVGFITKPFTFAEFIHAIKSALL